MEELYSVKLSKVIGEFSLEELHLPDAADNINITCSRVNRPGLQIVGFYDYYEQARLQIIGIVEHLYLEQLSPEDRYHSLEQFFRSEEHTSELQSL